MEHFIKDNLIYQLKEDIACVHQYLDDKNIPRADEKGQEYSIVGRIKQMEKGYLKQMSEIEDDYLSGERSKT